ncbi:siderophore-interacting protein [Cryptosporangium aurantiacum]|uniref:NADPH-dependent ferric siderophore reductase, contains FAD-binding and SIP domains n=1 Tax=Cryptosporangium aurantiacum TaxID=134849 RepID=A0A1M7RPN6_9ACTN|nr:siderophore-interacting protein [Cryptosporangium aurantiacum]SHN48234.1 NADPH-dependent ferric siderophore reductase, contains FAD-binding and SIP domains [Cryptosporangium aurantiacum]
MSLPMRVWTGEVVRTEDLTPALRRIVLGGTGLEGYATTGVGDEYLRLIFPTADSREPILPTVTDNCLDYGSIDLATMRTYTVRDFDATSGEVTIDFVIHDGGVAAEWARKATPGDLVGLNTPDGMYDPPEGLAWQFLIADFAALPAAARLIENVPAGVRTRVVLEVPDAEHQIELAAGPDVEVTWIHGGNGHAPSRLEQCVRSLPRPDGVGYIWVAGETREMRGVRKYLRKELGLPSTAFKTVGYWTDGAERWREGYAALDAETKESLEALWSVDADLTDIEIQYDERLARLGL